MAEFRYSLWTCAGILAVFFYAACIESAMNADFPFWRGFAVALFIGYRVFKEPNWGEIKNPTTKSPREEGVGE